jgi:hypothetical protein
MPDDQSEATTGPDELAGREAVQWLFRRRRQEGPHLMDTALLAVSEGFGRSADIAAFVPVEAPRDRRWRFFLAVDGDPSNDSDWRRLVRAHEALMLRDEWLTSLSPSGDPFARFHVVLAPDREDALPIPEATDQWLSR